jgi:hypothetical protein
MCFIIVYAIELDEKFKCLLGIIQTYLFKLPHNNYNNIQISSTFFYKLLWQHIFVHKICIKKLDSFSKI